MPTRYIFETKIPKILPHRAGAKFNTEQSCRTVQEQSLTPNNLAAPCRNKVEPQTILLHCAGTKFNTEQSCCTVREQSCVSNNPAAPCRNKIEFWAVKKIEKTKKGVHK